jgi:hypothetical protein
MVDVFGGVAVAAASIWVTGRYLEWLGHSQAATRASPVLQPNLGMKS